MYLSPLLKERQIAECPKGVERAPLSRRLINGDRNTTTRRSYCEKNKTNTLRESSFSDFLVVCVRQRGCKKYTVDRAVFAVLISEVIYNGARTVRPKSTRKFNGAKLAPVKKHLSKKKREHLPLDEWTVIYRKTQIMK